MSKLQQPQQLILASTSSYRKALLERLHLPFSTLKPDMDETPLPNEEPIDLAQRLAIGKAQSIADQAPNALVIGSDQVATLNGEVLGKPGSAEKAQQQLQRCSGQSVHFLTSLCLLNTQSQEYQVAVVPFEVQFKTLSTEQIQTYVELDNPIDCAGSFKWERLGIALFKRMSGEDVTALEGLPLITLIQMLQQEGVDPLLPGSLK